tara:strand:- start:536 stop:775 length:240 start_codon:yes stop_codon:yes gene_type:complete
MVGTTPFKYLLIFIEIIIMPFVFLLGCYLGVMCCMLFVVVVVTDTPNKKEAIEGLKTIVTLPFICMEWVWENRLSKDYN